VTWSTNCLDSLTAGLKQTTAFFMIANLYHVLYQGVLGWFCGLALELDLAHSGAVHLPIPQWLGPGASDRAQHLALQMNTSHQAFWSTLWGSGTAKGHIHASGAGIPSAQAL
jgi:hypothetical protein